MSKTTLPFHADDMSALARSLVRQIETHVAAHARAPSHLSLLNMLARAAGHRNFQSYRAQPLPAAAPVMPAPAAPVAAALPAEAERLFRLIDGQGRLTRWPTKRAVQQLAIWYMWTLFEGKRVYTEREVTGVLARHNAFDDPVILRRELINDGLLTRTPDGREYRKQPRRASPEVAALLRELRARVRAAAPARSARRSADR